ncbi:MAG: phytanoyl-CoA dioxygenase family protein, partial [Rickettsiales bacterium]|nr:phytanoyl-CoA dioxygenase family protein [Rickettsiales bacterium]
NWHQDEYLNPPGVAGWYVAVWMALDTIHPDAGPFEYVPGSHKWDLVRRDKVLEYISPEERGKETWPKQSERFLTQLFEDKVKEKGIKSQYFLAEKGDVLIWHSRLMHRGTEPKNRNLQRRTIITHYSGINHRVDMPVKQQHKGQGYYFVLDDGKAGAY